VVDPLVIAAFFFVAALLYASVGHAGASAYLAIMALASVSPDVARPTALALNILVATLVVYRFWRGGYVSWRAVAPFLLGSIPLAFLGGALPVAPGLYKKLVGVVLLLAAAGMALTARRAVATETGHAEPTVPAVPAVGIGASIGFVSGLTGTGGGIFLSPVVLLAGWAETRSASGMAAVFILGNSIAGLSGNLARLAALPSSLPIYAVAVVAGAGIGSAIGVRRGRPLVLRQALSAVLVIAGFKLIFLS
jgi:uncharacterized membrane protein YfcA